MVTLPLRDARFLHVLNRHERQAYLSNLKRLPEHQRRLTMLDLKQEVEAYDADGTLIKNKDQKLPTLKELILFALRAAHQDDTKTGANEKMERYALLKRIDAASEIELTEAEKKKINERVAKLYLQVEIIGQVAERLNPPVTAAGATTSVT